MARAMTTTRQRQRVARMLLWLTPALWSTNYLIARAAADTIAPHQLAFGRWALALALMLPFTWGALAARPREWLREWPQLLALGGLGMWICGAWVYLGGQTAPALNIGLIYAACPAGIALAGVTLLHERMSGAQRVAVGLSLAGVVYVVAKGDLANLRALRLTPGDGWIVAAALGWVAYSVLLSRWKSVLGPAPRLAAIVAGGLLVSLPFTLAEAAWTATPPWTWNAAGLVVAAALLPGALSYSAYSFVQRELGAARTGLMMVLSPLYAALLGWALLGEPPRAYHAIGAFMILPSIWLATHGAARR
jgi:drug/metabolite transporter (DMT)-like permease